MADKRRVLITGAGGRIGTSLTNAYKARYDLRLHCYPAVPDQPAVDDAVTGNLSDFAVARRALDGMDAVIHLAGNPSTQASWESVRDNNIEATYNVFEAARQAGAGKVVFATTNHVMGMYDRDGAWPVYANQPVRPDSLYGVSKAFGRKPRPPLRRPLRRLGDLPAHRLVFARAARRDQPLDVAQPARRRPDLRPGPEPAPLRRLLRHL